MHLSYWKSRKKRTLRFSIPGKNLHVMIMSGTTPCGEQSKDRQEILGKLPAGQKARATKCWPQTILSDSRDHHFPTPDSWTSLLKMYE